MAEMLADQNTQNLESTTVGIWRTAAVVKGGRRFSFGALVVVGDRHGQVGIGYGKAPGVPAAIEKAQKEARKSLVPIKLQGTTLPHPVEVQYGASRVKLLPAAPGTGVIAGATVRAVLELAGVRDCLTKAYGSTNQKNLCKAALQGLQQLRTKKHIEELRGLELEKTDVEMRIELGEKYAPKTSDRQAQVIAPQPKKDKGKDKAEGQDVEAGEAGDAAKAADQTDQVKADLPDSADGANPQHPEAGGGVKVQHQDAGAPTEQAPADDSGDAGDSGGAGESQDSAPATQTDESAKQEGQDTGEGQDKGEGESESEDKAQ